MNKLEKTIFGISVAIIGFFAIGLGISFYAEWSDPEGYAERQKEREIEIKAEEEAMEQKAMEQKIAQTSEEEMERNKLAMQTALKNYEMPKSFEDFEPATIPTGSLGAERLKYRPYWLVGDEWDEREWLGKISKSQDCVDAVTMIYDLTGELRDTMYRAWVKNCVTLP